jgi:hypothetical protein
MVDSCEREEEPSGFGLCRRVLPTRQQHEQSPLPWHQNWNQFLGYFPYIENTKDHFAFCVSVHPPKSLWNLVCMAPESIWTPISLCLYVYAARQKRYRGNGYMQR